MSSTEGRGEVTSSASLVAMSVGHSLEKRKVNVLSVNLFPKNTFVTCSDKRSFKSVLSLLRTWYSKTDNKMQFHVAF